MLTEPASTAAGYLRWIRDWWRLKAFRSSGDDGGAVIILLFHGLFRDVREAASGICDPQQGITVAFFAEFVESLLAHSIRIRTLEEALRQPLPGLSAVITFDDGYFNNLHALDVLEEFGVPATFFISTKHVEEQKSFWWDAVYRELRKRGATASSIRSQVRSLKGLKAAEIESRITGWFGPRALTPVSDCDRPFSGAELAGIASSRYVSLGNHTSDHAILDNYEPEGIRAQIVDAQDFLTRITGAAPTSIAYPNGNYNDRVLEIARSAGLEFGLTIRTGLNLATALEPMELYRLTIWRVPAAARQGRILSMALGRSAGPKYPGLRVQGKAS